MPNIITVASFNFLTGGYNDSTRMYTRLPALGQVIAQVPDIDVFVLCEAYKYDAEGYEILHQVEDMFLDVDAPMRGFLVPSQRSMNHQVMFVRWPRIRVRQNLTDHRHPDVNAYRAGELVCRIAGFDRDVVIGAEHWAPFSGDARLERARVKGHGAAPGKAAIYMGDFNCVWPGHPAVEWSRRLPHHDYHKTIRLPDGSLVPDLRATQLWAHMGYRPVNVLAGDWTATVNRHARDQAPACIDMIVVSPYLRSAVLPETYRVWIPEGYTEPVVNDERALHDPVRDAASGETEQTHIERLLVSDHRMVSVQLDLSRATQPATGTDDRAATLVS